MINTAWGWGQSHKGIVDKVRMLLFSVYRELGWDEHKQDLIEKRKTLKESDYKNLLMECMWYMEDNDLDKSKKYEDLDKLYRYMKKHRKA